MGWERKRGKLHELNLLLRDATSTTFITTTGRPPEPIPGVRYVITLDADTRLPRDAAARSCGYDGPPPQPARRSARSKGAWSMATASSNRASPRRCRRTARDRSFRKFSPAPAESILTLRLFPTCIKISSAKALTPAKVFTILMFSKLRLAGKVPENIMLSHDLFEGIFARTALATDIEFFDEFPSHYETAAARQHRWARGDWQLLPWIFGNARSPGGANVKIPVIGRWKMLDNLRRSLSAPCMFLVLLAGWLAPRIVSLALGAIRARNDIDSRASSIPRRNQRAPGGHLQAKPFPRRWLRICHWAYRRRP